MTRLLDLQKRFDPCTRLHARGYCHHRQILHWGWGGWRAVRIVSVDSLLYGHQPLYHTPLFNSLSKWPLTECPPVDKLTDDVNPARHVDYVEETVSRTPLFLQLFGSLTSIFISQSSNGTNRYNGCDSRWPPLIYVCTRRCGQGAPVWEVGGVNKEFHSAFFFFVIYLP